jgi:hypothetical protein
VGEVIEYLVRQRPGFNLSIAGEYLLSFGEIATHARPMTVIEIEDIVGQPITLRQFLPQGWRAIAYHEGRVQVTIGRWPKKFAEQQR